jgi:hypothetical protein
MHPNALLERMDSFFSLFYNLDKRYFAPLELDYSISLYPWFSNQGNRYFAPSELDFSISLYPWFYNLDKRYFAPLELDYSISLYPWFCNQGNRYFAPSELDFSISLYPWFCNQGNRYFAPSELGSIKPHRGYILVRPSVSSVSETTNHHNKPRSGETFVTLSESSVKSVSSVKSESTVKKSTNKLATSWRHIGNTEHKFSKKKKYGK